MRTWLHLGEWRAGRWAGTLLSLKCQVEGLALPFPPHPPDPGCWRAKGRFSVGQWPGLV